MTHYDHRFDNALIRSSIRLKVPLAKQNDVLDILHSISDQIKSEPDCIHAHLYRGVNDAELIMFEELWKKQASLNHHLRSRVYQKILVAIEMARVPPEIRFDRIMDSTGIETLIRIRKGAAPDNETQLYTKNHKPGEAEHGE